MANTLFKQPGKMLRIPESQFIRDLIYRFAPVKYFLFSYVNHLCLYVFLGRFSGFFFYQVSKITGR